ncbi:MAG: hypothetical protein ACUVRM_08400 [Bacillota bacterium]
MPPDFDYGERLLRLRLGYSLHKMGFQGYWEQGEKYDNLLAETQIVKNMGVSVSYRPQNNQGLEAYYYTGFDRFTGLEKDLKTTAGLGMWYRVNNNLFLDLKFQQSRVGEASVRNELSLGVNLCVPNGNVLDLKVRWSWSNGVLEEDAPAMEMNYRRPFAIPVSRKKNIGLLRGRVYDAESPGEPGIKGVILKLIN